MTLALLALTSITTAEYSSSRHLTLNMEEIIRGDGYFMSYKYASMPNSLGHNWSNSNGVEAGSFGHGSGTIDTQTVLLAESSNKTEGALEDAPTLDYQEALSWIQLNEDAAMIYGPAVVKPGTGYYSTNPIRFSSLLKEKTWIKNRGSATSMINEIEYAHAVDKDLEIMVKSFISEEDPSVTMMDVSEDVTEGKLHIGQLQGDTNAMDFGGNPLARSAWKNPLLEIDEDFIGTYRLEKIMNLTATVEEEEEDEDWLPCCHGGYEGISPEDRKGYAADGIFDCTCFPVPERAEFPR